VSALVAAPILSGTWSGLPRRLILTNHQSPGDIVMLTAAVRDLHRAHPAAFVTDVRTSCPAIWERNPHITPLDVQTPGVETIQCEYPLIHESNTAPYHFIHGFIEHLNERLGTRVRPTEFRGDIHLGDDERSWTSQVQDLTGIDEPFWIVSAGGKYDYTIKWWDPRRFQSVVDHFAGRIRFVQVGERQHHHPPLRGVIDLRGRTDLRQLIRLVYHAAGIITPVSLLMHLAAAVATRPDRPGSRPCVVIAGGREPTQWEAYPGHQFLHTIGALACCETGGCWRSRTLPLLDGDVNDHADRLCLDVVGHLPRCMHLITAAHVIDRIELYLARPSAI
jgi:ADP-heptose:LPS heptosyltransferase